VKIDLIDKLHFSCPLCETIKHQCGVKICCNGSTFHYNIAMLKQLVPIKLNEMFTKTAPPFFAELLKKELVPRPLRPIGCVECKANRANGTTFIMF